MSARWNAEAEVWRIPIAAVIICLVNVELKDLLELARPGQPDPFQRLVEALRRLSQTDPAVLIEFAKSDDELQRRAAITAAAGRTEPEVIAAISGLAFDGLSFVRQALAYAL